MKAVTATLRSALADAFARRAAFWSQATVMVVNDMAWVTFWFIFFNRVGQVRRWDTDSVMLLLAMLTTSAGIVLGLLSNARRIPQLVADGALDETLSLPVAPLWHLLVRRIDPVNVGDVLFGVALFVIIGQPTPGRVLAYAAGVVASVVLLTGFLVTAGSTVFFTGRSQAGDLGLHAILLLASYPADVFGGYTKVLMFTVVPAAFVSAVPARLIDDFSLGSAVGLLTAAAAFAVVAWATFSLGLRRYTSGSAWTRG